MDISRKIIVFIIFLIFIGICVATSTGVSNKTMNDVNMNEIIISRSYPPSNRNTISRDILPKSSVIIDEVPSSEWTYGCTATAAGMLFGYYDRIGYYDMYTGPTNGGMCPLTNLGQATPSHPDYPNPGSCYIIATEQGLDGITTKAHVDDYWISYGSNGPDPWDGNWPEHNWDLCIADFLGTNQWIYDQDGNGQADDINDGGTFWYYYSDGSKRYDPIPTWDMIPGATATACCHGLRLFAESRGYTVEKNYNQLTNTAMGHPAGFTFNEFQNEINAGRPVLTQWRNAANYGHSMLGIGYDTSSNTIYFHDAWDNDLHYTTWDGQYSDDNFELNGVTVIQLEEISWPLIDSSQSLFDRGFRIMPGWDASQEFTPTLNTISSVKLYMSKFGSPSGNVTVQICDGSAGGTVLNETELSPDEVPSYPVYEWVTIDIEDVSVTPGETYYIVMKDAQGADTHHCIQWGWCDSYSSGSGGPYDGGWFWFRKEFNPTWSPIRDWDFTFRTFGYDL